MDVATRVRLPMDEIARFCQRWKVTELALFGSVLRDDFGPDSGIDVLVTFAPDTTWTLMDMVEASEQLETAFGRPVDPLSRRAVEGSMNWIRRGEILSNAEPIYRAIMPHCLTSTWLLDGPWRLFVEGIALDFCEILSSNPRCSIKC